MYKWQITTIPRLYILRALIQNESICHICTPSNDDNHFAYYHLFEA